MKKLKSVITWILLIITGLWIVRLICIETDKSTKNMFKDMLSEEEYSNWEKQYYGLTKAFDNQHQL